MNPHRTGPSKRPKLAVSQAALSLEEELVAAIHGAFEVAVEIAVREVTKLVAQTTGDAYEDLRRQNQSLKQRLQRAEALLDSGVGGSPTKQSIHANNNRAGQTLHFDGNQKSSKPIAGSCMEGRGDAHQHRAEEQSSAGDVDTQHGSDHSASDDGGDDACDAFTKDVSEQISGVCAVRRESINQPCRELAAQDHDLALLPSNDESTLKQFSVKQEKPEEEGDDAACCLDLIKMEDFSPECMSAVQSKMLEEWKPEVLDIQGQDSIAPLSCSTLAQDHQSPSSEFPKIFQLTEPPEVSENPPQVHGAHGWTSRNLSHNFTNSYTCKSCGQTFHLPSLLRRHHGQCQQKLQQCYQQPVNGSKRTRLQLYPPGCSPFRCTECNREFNRMENLKTHLRIHTGERPYTCSVCFKCFRHSGALTRHFRIHTGEKPYICGQCGKSFRNCGGLKFHQRSHSKQLQ